MVRLELILFILEIIYVIRARHEKPVHKTLWPQSCTAHSYAMNDCNWCWCNKNSEYSCHARVCAAVDMFGHFNDAVQNIDVGMEGHGVWRSTQTACEPGVQYKRDKLTCICNEDGNWPNPVCRDNLRILHPVEMIGRSKSNRCVSTRLYVVGCNVCYCPASGLMDPQLCTDRKCTEDDPVLNDNRVEYSQDVPDQEFYATCDPEQEYKIGCKKCNCLGNNRLLCDNCPEPASPVESSTHYCSKTKPGRPFALDCNFCFCDRKYVLYCTSKQCIKGLNKYNIGPSLFETSNLVSVSAPHDDSECSPGTKYNKGTNECYCARTSNGKKVYACTVKEFDSDDTAFEKIKSNCVEGEVYYLNCQICRCDVIAEVKRETCVVDTKCSGTQARGSRLTELRSLRGYCEPYHDYVKDCNTCRCLADGKVVECTPNICNGDEENRTKEPVTVDLIPINQNDGEECPKDHMYKVDCNVCFCLANGNVLCTTTDCNKKV